MFYPWGALGKGYYVPDPLKEKEIKNFVTPYSAITGAATFLIILLGQESILVWILLFLFLGIDIFWYRIQIAKLTRGLEVINIGSESYCPPVIEKRYRGLFTVILLCGFVGGSGNIYNNGFSLNDFFVASGSAIFLFIYSYVTWIRK